MKSSYLISFEQQQSYCPGSTPAPALILTRLPQFPFRLLGTKIVGSKSQKGLSISLTRWLSTMVTSKKSKSSKYSIPPKSPISLVRKMARAFCPPERTTLSLPSLSIGTGLIEEVGGKKDSVPKKCIAGKMP